MRLVLGIGLGFASRPVAGGEPAPEPRWLFYAEQNDSNWNTLGNWFLDSEQLAGADALPRNGDTVSIIAGNVSVPPAVPISLLACGVGSIGATVNVEGLTASNFEANGEMLTITGSFTASLATFGGTAVLHGTLAGNAVFTQGATCVGVVNGNAELHASTDYPTGTYPLGGSISGTIAYFGFGCMDISATNYDPGAIVDIGNCTWE